MSSMRNVNQTRPTNDKAPQQGTAEQARERDGDDERPFFSIVMPVWNRSDTLRECLDSVFTQEFADFEVIAVDDASTDSSPVILGSYADPRMKVIRLPENRGVCAARNAGTAAASGQWVVSLDTDWALVDGALAALAEMAQQAAPDVGVIGGHARTDQGETWPVSPVPEGPFGFIEFLRWCDSGHATDYLPSRRRKVFDTVQWPTDRRWETQFHLKVSWRWKMWISPQVLATVRTDSPNRLTADSSAGADARKLQMAPDLATDAEETLAAFGSDLMQHAPHVYWSVRESAAIYGFISGRRGRGVRHALAILAHRPWAVQVLGLVLAGLIGPSAVLRARRMKAARSVFSLLSR